MKMSEQKLSLNSIILLSAVLGGVALASTSPVESVQSQNPQQEQVNENSTPSAQAEPKFTVLPDKFSVLKGALVSELDTHYYGFTALRGQRVLAKGYYPASLKFEIHDGTQWISVDSNQDWVLPSPKPGQDVIVRFSHRKGMTFVNGVEYGLNLGSFPQVTRTRLKDQPVGMARIPPDAAPFGPLSAQGISNLLLEIDMADSTGKALEGGIASLHISLPHSSNKKIDGFFATDANGRIRQKIDIGRCNGGADALPFVEKNRGRNLWRTQYYEGTWSVHNFFAPTTGVYSTHYDSGQVAHICYQRLVKGSPYETGLWN